MTADYQTAVGTGGYGFVICDTSGATSCLLATALCAAGSTVAGPSSALDYGAGFGVNLGQAMAATTTPSYTIPAGATGIKYALSTPPAQGVQIILDDSTGTSWCALATAASGTLPWSSFTPAYCGNTTMPAATAAPVGPTHINFQVPPATAASTFNFCVTSVGFGP